MSTLSYNLGKRAHKNTSTKCEPLKDKVFMLYMKKYNMPFVLSVTEYTQGYHERKARIDTAANARRLEFSLV